MRGSVEMGAQWGRWCAEKRLISAGTFEMSRASAELKEDILCVAGGWGGMGRGGIYIYHPHASHNPFE